MFDSEVKYSYEELVAKAKKKGDNSGQTYALLAIADRLDEILKIIRDDEQKGINI